MGSTVMALGEQGTRSKDAKWHHWSINSLLYTVVTIAIQKNLSYLYNLLPKNITDTVQIKGKKINKK